MQRRWTLPVLHFMRTHVSTWSDEYGRLWLFQQSFKPTAQVASLLDSGTVDGHLVFMHAADARHPLQLGSTVRLTRGDTSLTVEVTRVLDSVGSRSGFKFLLIVV